MIREAATSLLRAEVYSSSRVIPWVGAMSECALEMLVGTVPAANSLARLGGRPQGFGLRPSRSIGARASTRRFVDRDYVSCQRRQPSAAGPRGACPRLTASTCRTDRRPAGPAVLIHTSRLPGTISRAESSRIPVASLGDQLLAFCRVSRTATRTRSRARDDETAREADHEDVPIASFHPWVSGGTGTRSRRRYKPRDVT